MNPEKESEKAEVVAEVVGFDIRKLLTTFRDLTLKPGQTVAAYCDGDRRKYVSAYTYFLITFGINYFFTAATGILDDSSGGEPAYMAMFREGYMIGNPNAPAEKVDRVIGLLRYGFEFMMSKEGMILSSLPVFVLVQWLFYRSYRKSFFHNLYFVLFVCAQINILTVPLVLLILASPTLVIWVALITSVAAIPFYIWAESKFYPGVTPDQLVVRTIGQIATGIVPYIIWSLTYPLNLA